MGALTRTEREAFSAEQLAEIDKFSPTRRDSHLDVPSGRQTILSKWAAKTPVQLRAKVCLDNISWGSQVVITWSTDSDVSALERQSVEDLLVAGAHFVDVFADAVAGKRSLEQRMAVLEGR